MNEDFSTFITVMKKSKRIFFYVPCLHKSGTVKGNIVATLYLPALHAT